MIKVCFAVAAAIFFLSSREDKKKLQAFSLVDRTSANQNFVKNNNAIAHVRLTRKQNPRWHLPLCQ